MLLEVAPGIKCVVLQPHESVKCVVNSGHVFVQL